MRRFRPIPISFASLVLLASACDVLPPTGTSALADRPALGSTATLGRPLPLVSALERALFDRGAVVFARVFTPEMGLGPLFNGAGCAKCHTEPAPGGTGVQAALHATAFRGGVCDGLAAKGGPVFQLNVTRALHDAFGIYEVPVPPEATATARRTTPPLWGAGLLDAVPDSAILARAHPDGDGVAGRPNWTADGRLGRFGRKAQVATLREFVGAAFITEMGITNPLFPAEQTLAGKPLPPGVDPAPDPEISPEDFDAADAFVRLLAPPEPVGSAMLALRGRSIFTATGCTACHVPELETGANPVRALSRQVVPAYTDLLLHDMGPNLADICLGQALPAEFRTEPLWGLRFEFEFLHDGRAKTIDEAVRLHGGQASGARERYLTLSATERAVLLEFLGSL
jgi:CxxC motif-containing protein (DUF1111 family)